MWVVLLTGVANHGREVAGFDIRLREGEICGRGLQTSGHAHAYPSSVFGGPAVIQAALGTVRPQVLLLNARNHLVLVHVTVLEPSVLPHILTWKIPNTHSVRIQILRQASNVSFIFWRKKNWCQMMWYVLHIEYKEKESYHGRCLVWQGAGISALGGAGRIHW